MFINTKEMALLVADRMVSIVDANRKSFIETDDFESVFENCFDMLVATKIPEWAYTDTYNKLEASDEVQLAYSVLKNTIEEDRLEAALYNKNVAIGGYMYAEMRSRGLSQKDFI